jgi:hypothetical protein
MEVLAIALLQALHRICRTRRAEPADHVLCCSFVVGNALYLKHIDKS